MAAYRDTLRDKALAENNRYFKVKDVAFRLRAGTGSLGYSVGNHALWHAKGYRKLTYRTDRFLGWMHLESLSVGDGENERDVSGYCSVRERSSFKEVFPREALHTRTTFAEMAEQWAEVIATDHARANQDLPKHVLKHTGDDKEKDFAQQVRSIAFDYADQVQTDWESFKALRE